MASFNLTAAAQNAATPNTARRTTERQASPFDGYWLNLGVNVDMKDTDTGEVVQKFVRLPRGVAVSDLEEQRVYASTRANNPEWAAQADVINAIIKLIQQGSAELEEGESVELDLKVQLYRKQEAEVDNSASTVDMDALAANLFKK